jgi:uncharacterized damage-inducible protein DinB
MIPQLAALMATYNRWMNQRLYQAASTLPEAEVLRDRNGFFGSILQTLNHIAAADTIWLHRFATASSQHWLAQALTAFPRPVSLRQEMGKNLVDLGAYRARLDQVIIDWTSKLTAEQLTATLTYSNMAGQKQGKNFGALVLHYFNHQTHHRGQATTLLFQAGVDVGVTDLLAVIPGEI